MSMTTALKKVSIVNVPFDLGASRRGASLGPDSIVSVLEPQLMKLDYDYQLTKIVCPDSPVQGSKDERLKNLDQVVQVNKRLAEVVGEIVKEEGFPLILGGDHSIAIGSIAGLTKRYKKMGVIWFDAHGDLNTEDTSPSGNIHGMSLAASLGLGNSQLTQLAGFSPKIKPENVVIIGARDLDPEEKTLIHSKGITCFTMHEIDRMGMAEVVKEAIKITTRETDGVHLSFDLDGLDPMEAPGTGTPVRGGVSYREAHLALEMLHEAGIITSAEFVEVNPELDINNKTSELAVELIFSLLGHRIL